MKRVIDELETVRRDKGILVSLINSQDAHSFHVIVALLFPIEWLSLLDLQTLRNIRVSYLTFLHEIVISQHPFFLFFLSQ